MSYRLFELKTRVAQKQHRCIWCGESIEPGAKYLDERSVYEGQIQRHRWHPECMPVCQQALRESGDSDFDAYQNERPSQHQPV